MEERLDLFSTLFPSVLTALRFACEHVNFLPFRRTPRGVFLDLGSDHRAHLGARKPSNSIEL